jgi:hypothetical protein
VNDLLERLGQREAAHAQAGDGHVSRARRGRTLHNHAAHCLSARYGPVTEWWTVEALPAESDALWPS